MTKNPADNVRFGATAAVTPQKVTCEHERKQPAERAVEAAAAPSRRPLLTVVRCMQCGLRNNRHNVVLLAVIEYKHL